MATITLGANVSMNDDLIFDTGDSYMSGKSSTAFTETGNGKTILAQGIGFTFGQYDVTGGTMTSFTISTNGVTSIVATNLSANLANSYYDTGYGGERPGMQSELANWFSGNDVISGNAGSEYLKGYAGNDSLQGYAGNDTIDGGLGVDLAKFSGNFANYTITNVSTNSVYAFTVHDNVGSEGTDTLLNVERLQFADKTVAFDIDGNAGEVYRLYQAAFNRAPDQGGLGYWIDEMDQGMGLTQVATGFINSPEFKSLYGSNPSNEQFVSLLYDNVLHRTPDAGGYAYWTEQLAGGVAREDALIGFSESTENKVALMAFSMDGNMGKDYRLYQAAFDRKPDVSGLDYWYHQMNSGMSLDQVASKFINSAEFKSLYGSNPSNEQFVTLLYDNVLHRAPDAAGSTYWTDQLAAGMSKEEVLIGFSESHENQISLVGIVQTGIAFI